MILKDLIHDQTRAAKTAPASAPSRHFKSTSPELPQASWSRIEDRQAVAGAARDRVMMLLSVKAGLRACEISGLDWSMVLGAQGKVSGAINVRDIIAKMRGGRRIPMHPDLRLLISTET